MKHKHYDCIIAWANGKEIEYRDKYSPEWSDVIGPSWSTECDYRIKPTTIKFRNYLYKGYNRIDLHLGISLYSSTSTPELNQSFIKWIGDWQEVEIPEELI